MTFGTMTGLEEGELSFTAHLLPLERGILELSGTGVNGTGGGRVVSCGIKVFF